MFLNTDCYSIHELLFINKKNMISNDLKLFKTETILNIESLQKKFQGYVKIKKKNKKYINCIDSEFQLKYLTTKVLYFNKQLHSYNENDLISFKIIIVDNKPYAINIYKIINENSLDLNELDTNQQIETIEQKLNNNTSDNQKNIVNYSKHHVLHLRRYKGIVKIYWQDKNYGFIFCDNPEYIKIFNKDPLLHKNQKDMSKCEIGDLISFIIETVNGQPQARSVRLEGKRYIGTLHSKDNNYGIISCNDENYIKLYDNKNIFLDINNIVNCLIGDLLSFIVVTFKKKLQARYIIPVEKYTGIIKVYHKDKNFGFISCNDINYVKIYGSQKDVFFEIDQFKDNLSQDDFVSLYVININGYPFAKDIFKINTIIKYIGIIKIFYEDKSYGFINCNDINYLERCVF